MPSPSTRLDRLTYILILLTALLAAYYSYRVAQGKTDVGRWWSRTIIKRSRQSGVENATCHEADGIEELITALARALEIPSNRLAEAVAVAVRENMPSRSSSSAPV